MQLALLDILIFLGYFCGVIAFAVLVAWLSKTRDSASDYFLASKKLPWYAVGASFVASNISTEHFIGTVGWGFLYGMGVANWEWGNAITFTALISSGDPSQGTTYTLIAVTALVLGGASLGGGRAGVFGSFLGASNLYLITFVLATFNFGAVQSFVTNLAYGSILVVSLLLTLIIPFIQRHIHNFSPVLYFVVSGVIVLGVILHATNDRDPRARTPVETDAEIVRMLEPIAPEELYVAPLEVARPNATDTALRTEAAPLILSALLLIVIAVFVRIAVTQSDRKTIAPAVAVVVVALVLFGAYLLRHDGQAAPPAGQAEDTR